MLRARMKTKRRTEITIETHEALTVARRQHTFRAWCPKCKMTTDMSSPETAASLRSCSQREIFLGIETRKGDFSMKIQHSLGLVVIWGVAITLALYVALHFLRPDYDPARRFLSEYAVGPFGVLGTAEFFSQAVITFALAWGLFLDVRRSKSLLAGCCLLSITGATFIALALFPADLSDPGGGAPRLVTRSGAIHHFSGVVSFLSRIVAFLILAAAYNRDDHWRGFGKTTRSLGLALLLLFFLTIFLEVRWNLGGLGQRAAVAVSLLLFLLHGLRLRRSEHNSLDES